MYEDDRWDSWETAKRLERLDRGSSEILWTEAAGLVRARRLSSRNGLWDFTPLSGSKWQWVMVGQDDWGWKVTFAGGWDPPTTLHNQVYDAKGALTAAVDFLGYDPAVREQEVAVEAATEAVRHEGELSAPAADTAVPPEVAAVDAAAGAPALDPAQGRQPDGGAGLEM